LRTYARPILPAVVIGLLLVACGGSTGRTGAADAGGGQETSSPPAASSPAAEPGAAVRAVRLRIPRIGVDTSLERLGVNPRGKLRPPVRAQRAGWFPGSAVPGELGAAVVAGHRDSAKGPAVFWRLTELRPGDRMTVRRSDGVTARFEVAEVRRVSKRQFPTRAVYGATPDRTLRLITCGGDFDHAKGHYRDNILVLALAV